MKTHDIRPLDKPVSALGMGTKHFCHTTKQRHFAQLDAFVACGGTYLDTAEIYGCEDSKGCAEAVIGDWLAARKGARDKIIIAAKGVIPDACKERNPYDNDHSAITPDAVHRSIGAAISRLGVKYLDLWMFHRDSPELPVGPLVDALHKEMRDGRILAYGASNWQTWRIQEALDYARAAGENKMIASSPHYSLARANEPYYRGCISACENDLQWHAEHNFLMVAWASMGGGFFARGDRADRSDANLARVFYSDANFARKERAEQLAAQKNTTAPEIALSYVISHDFPVVALCGARTTSEVESAARATETTLSASEREWLNTGIPETARNKTNPTKPKRKRAMPIRVSPMTTRAHSHF